MTELGGKVPTDHTKQSGADGQFRRQSSIFRHCISPDPTADFPAEKDRYVLYLNYGCPWAHRTNIVRSLKGLEEVVSLVVCDFILTSEGWLFTGADGSHPKDPLYGFTRMKDLYRKADPDYDLRFTVPLLWDKKKETIVSNESSDIIRMFYTAFDHLLPEYRQEKTLQLLPSGRQGEIDEFNAWVYERINNGVYKTGFASSQEAYEANLFPLFEALQRVEDHLGQSAHHPFLFGSHPTEADIRLFPTIIRFDAAYHTIFKCNLKMIRHDFPLLDRWLRRLYWRYPAFKDTTRFDCFKRGYAATRGWEVWPRGPLPEILGPVDDS